MSVPIGAMRDRLLAKLAEKRPIETWIEVLASAHNRDLLGLIGRERPQSIGALADLAGRAQPNVSRALTSLISAKLVETNSDGRRTIPLLTPLGVEKACELKLLDRPIEPDTHGDGNHLVVTVAEGVPLVDEHDRDVIPGLFKLTLREKSASRASTVSLRTDLNELALRVLADWWRLLYRRDSAWRLGEATLNSVELDRPVTVWLHSNGRSAQFLLRDRQSEAVSLERNSFKPTADFEYALIDAFLRPLAESLRTAGRPDRPLHSMLSRIEESRDDADERAFCRVAGAFNISPYNLSNAIATDVRKVVAQFPDEDARLDFASSLAIDELQFQDDWLKRELVQHSGSNGLGVLDQLRARCARVSSNAPLPPWRLGRNCARLVRDELGLGVDRNVRGVDSVARLFGTQKFKVSEMAPGALRGFQTLEGGQPVVLVEDEGPETTAFTLCRAVGDYLVHGSETSCVADIYTERQAVGRAFAAEFLAPGEGVVRMTEEEGQSSGKIARHYGVSPYVISHQYRNYSRLQ